MFRTSSCRVHRRCVLRTLLAHGVMNATLYCRLFPGQLLLPNLFTLPVLGMASARLLTEIVSRQSFAAIAEVFVVLTRRRWENWLTTLTILYSVSWRLTRITYSISYCLRVVTLAMTCDVDYITIVYLHRNLLVLYAIHRLVLKRTPSSLLITLHYSHTLTFVYTGMHTNLLLFKYFTCRPSWVL